tara:strand:+ start:2869 stop:3990 length:1122 start_codon:yes stop_codon:yes gene_type:complete
MEIKVKAVGETPEKSPQEREQELLDKHEQQNQETPNPSSESTETAAVASKEIDETPVTEKVKKEVELSEDDVLSHINKRYNKEIKSVDELFAEREDQKPLPEDVSAYLKYRQETGRGFEDYVKLNRDFSSIDDDNLLREYLTETEEGLDRNDIEDLMTEYKYDDLDEEGEIKKIKLAKKKKIAQAKKHFKKQKEYYKEPLESSTASIPEVELEKIRAYEQQMQDAKKLEEESEKRRNWFAKKTDEVFGSGFKGFEFTLDDKKLTYSPGDVAEIKKIQSTPLNFINKYVGEDGMIKDANGYHKALAVAMNPERFAKFFYEQGKSFATEDVMRKTKNINMTTRNTPEVATKGGMKIRSMNTDSGRGLKIKSLRKK